MPQGNRNGDYQGRGDRQRDQEARQREQDHDLELDRRRQYDGTFRPEDSNYHGERLAHDRRGGAPPRDRRPEPRGGGYNFGDPYDQRNYDSGGFGYGGTNGSGGGFGVGGNGPQTGGYGSQANYGEGYFGGSSSERDWADGLGHDPDARYEPGAGRRARGRDHHHEAYLNWRDNHIRSLDEEYEAYRAEHQSKFNEDFNTWRSSRDAAPKADKARSGNPTAGGEEAEKAKKGH